MAAHTISEKELNEWLCRPQWQIFALCGGLGSNKRLEVDSSESGHTFRVVDHGKTVFLGADKAAAIAAYNSAC